MPQILTPGELDHRATGHSCDAISQKETICTECSQATLELILERVSCLEQDIQKLRHWLLVQPSRIRQTGNVPAHLSTTVNVFRLRTPGAGDWDISCLGNFHLRCAGREVPPCNSRRGKSVLKYLLSSPGLTASTEVLVDRFWPQMDAVAGAPNLQVAIHTLRCSLRGCGPGGSDETVLFRHSRYLLNPALSIVQDVDAFRAAYERGLCAGQAGRTTEATLAFEQARATYTGDHLADPYEESASGTRVALQDRWLHVLDQLGALYSQAGTWEQAIACYREILVVDYYREDVYLRQFIPRSGVLFNDHHPFGRESLDH
ncbi:MAG TPA: bacterial transcriptional activator domain-containing protein [Ktedonobacteraceae bacterium]|nr:bacterial transcriptional activator domain-containing protein [Ktedonobacteraceae bacterium]